MSHFLINNNQIENNYVVIKDKNLIQHIVKVMRSKLGEKILFLDENEIQYETILKNIEKDYFKAEILLKYKSKRKLPLNLYIAQSVLNSDDQISSIKKAVELGVKGIIPLYTNYCVVKKSIIISKIAKWEKIILESVKQCERADIPKIFNVSEMKDIINNYDRVIVFAEKYAEKNFFEYIKAFPINKQKSILIIIGPEGGFSETEFDYFKSNNIPLITLGDLIYRADTALVAAITTVINGVLYG